MDEKKPNTGEIVCGNCGAKYNKLPAFTCPRCGAALCKSGCEGCTRNCAAAGSRGQKQETRG